jgi:predicted dehydrogenase
MFSVAIIGCGNVVYGIDLDTKKRHIFGHYKALEQLTSSFKVQAVYDIDLVASTFLANKFECRAYHNLNKLISSESIDLYIIATPTAFHEENINCILNSGCRAILCEKPLTYSYEDSVRILRNVAAKDIAFYINYPRRYDDFYKNIKKLIDENIYGHLKFISGFSDNSLYMNASHMINLIDWYAGEVDVVEGFIDTNNQVRVVHGVNDPGGYILCRHKSGTTSFIKASNVSQINHMFELDLHFESARIRLLDDDKAIEVYKWRESNQHKGLIELQLEQSGLNVVKSERLINLYTEINLFLTGKKKGPNACEIALGTQHIIDSVYDNSR